MRARTPWHSRQISRHDDFLPDRISESVAEAGRRDIAPFQGDGEEGAESERKTSTLARRLVTASGLRETRFAAAAACQVSGHGAHRAELRAGLSAPSVAPKYSAICFGFRLV